MSNNDWKSRLGTVYSTDPTYSYDTDRPDQTTDTLPVSRQKLRIALDKRNRGGKQVTIVSDYVGLESDLTELCKSLKHRLGVGGSVKDRQIIIQGDFRDRLLELLTHDGYKARKI